MDREVQIILLLQFVEEPAKCYVVLNNLLGSTENIEWHNLSV